jgi:heme a synthase
MKQASSAVFRPYLHYYGAALSVLTLVLLFIGGMVTSTNSGLAVPDWPTTFGQNMFTFPPSMMKGGIFYEHGHRLAASLVGFLTIGNCLALWIWDSRRWLRWTGSLALLLVIVQGVLGGITVHYKLPMPISAAHACVAELFLCLTVLMAFATSRLWIRTGARSNPWSTVQTLSLVFWILVFLQIMVGAVMRHSFAGLAIPTFPMAFGQFIPPFWSFGIALNFIHTRLGSSLLVVVGTLLICKVVFSAQQARLSRVVAGLLGVLLLLQCLLGMLAIWSGKAPVPATIHLAAGALVFATGFLLFLAVSRLPGPIQKRAGLPEQAGVTYALPTTEDGMALT